MLSQVGGWEWFQGLLACLQGIADKHGTSLSNVAARWGRGGARGWECDTGLLRPAPYLARAVGVVGQGGSV